MLEKSSQKEMPKMRKKIQIKVWKWYSKLKQRKDKLVHCSVLKDNISIY